MSEVKFTVDESKIAVVHGGWQPIETAPKDDFILASTVGAKLPMVALYDEDDGWIALNGAFKRDWKPTHWMPLPAPPNG
jgi:hypothetical protein